MPYFCPYYVSPRTTFGRTKNLVLTSTWVNVVLSKKVKHPADVSIPKTNCALSVIRIFIGSYFLAMGMNLIPAAADVSFLTIVMTEQYAVFATNLYFFGTAFAMMLGFRTRQSALLLAGFYFAATVYCFLHCNFGDPIAIAGFWKDMVLLSALLLIAATDQRATTNVRVFRKPVTPRRVQLSKAIETPRSTRCDTANHPGHSASSVRQTDAFGDVSNIFDEICKTPKSRF